MKPVRIYEMLFPQLETEEEYLLRCEKMYTLLTERGYSICNGKMIVNKNNIPLGFRFMVDIEEDKK